MSSFFCNHFAAVNECGAGEPGPVSVEFTPMAPTSEIPSIRCGATTDESIELKWEAPIDQGPLGMSGYLVQFQGMFIIKNICLLRTINLKIFYLNFAHKRITNRLSGSTAKI